MHRGQGMYMTNGFQDMIKLDSPPLPGHTPFMYPKSWCATTVLLPVLQWL